MPPFSIEEANEMPTLAIQRSVRFVAGSAATGRPRALLPGGPAQPSGEFRVSDSHAHPFVPRHGRSEQGNFRWLARDFADVSRHEVAGQPGAECGDQAAAFGLGYFEMGRPGDAIELVQVVGHDA